MNVAIVTSVSANVADMATITTPNKLEYCLRHGYSLVLDNQPYDEAVLNTHHIANYLNRFDMVWTMDADTVITDMTQRIETLPYIGPHMTVCEEGIVEWNRFNCGSVVWRNTPETRGLLHAIHGRADEWRSLPCQWQTWLSHITCEPANLITVAPVGAFNSCVWNRPANARDEIGGHWKPGDFVYHPCGVFPASEKLKWVQKALQTVTR
jgi:hypothetical protein